MELRFSGCMQKVHVPAPFFNNVNKKRIMKNQEEVWLPIKGYKNCYHISNYGRVKSLDRIISNGIKTKRLLKGQMIKNKCCKQGYHYVILSNMGKSKTFRVHRLVALNFIENTLNLTDVNHIDGDKKNNFVSNIEWSTRSNNIEHAYINKLRTDNKFVPEQILEIRNSKNSIRSLARRFMVDRNTIKQILTRRTYNWVK